MFYRYKKFIPQVDDSAFIAESAKIIGNVVIGEDSSVWYHTALRAEDEQIKIGDCCSIQEHTLIHVDKGYPVTVEDNVTVGHHAILHGCHIKEGTLVGMGATILNGAVIGENCVIGANTLITSGVEIPPNSLVMGSPGKIVREITDEEKEILRQSADIYVKFAREYRNPDIVQKLSRDQLK